jgi:hypothetical protein
MSPNVLAERELSVHVEARQHLIAVVLRDQPLRSGGERRVVRLGPPVLERAGGVVEAPLIVEGVAHLVADHRADAAVVHRVVGVRDRRTAAAGWPPGT